jgi:hypothetical protein
LYIPWLKLIEIDIGDDIEINALIGDLLPQVVLQELLFSWMKSETRRDLRLPIHRYTHVFSHFEYQKIIYPDYSTQFVEITESETERAQ